MRKYKCSHCLRELSLVDGDVEACPQHPDGSVEIVEEVDEHQEL